MPAAVPASTPMLGCPTITPATAPPTMAIAIIDPAALV
jgi:hypothetical protein